MIVLEVEKLRVKGTTSCVLSMYREISIPATTVDTAAKESEKMGKCTEMLVGLHLLRYHALQNEALNTTLGLARTHSLKINVENAVTSTRLIHGGRRVASWC